MKGGILAVSTPSEFPLVLDTRIDLDLHFHHVSSGLQQPEIVGFGWGASQTAKIQRATITAHNPEADGANTPPTARKAAVHAIGSLHHWDRIRTHNLQYPRTSYVVATDELPRWRYSSCAAENMVYTWL